MRKILCLLLLASTASITVCTKLRVKKHHTCTKIRDRSIRTRAPRNMPNERIRHEDDGTTRCLINTKEIIAILGTLIAIGFSIATFIIATA